VESSNPHEQHNHTTNSKLQVGDGDGKWEHFQHLKKTPNHSQKKPFPKLFFWKWEEFKHLGKKKTKEKQSQPISLKALPQKQILPENASSSSHLNLQTISSMQCKA
jgi:hypothetical protein